ncbi:MAG: 3-hydroxyacyl-CoA dehydrogenase family protein [Nitrospiraceae bacterium]|nr:3-hydroxyacyl-CoA dehydrogenase family protein [Nitrospiraceae bacterium]
MRIGIIGAGTMGVGIAHAVATSGWDALVVEPDDTQRDKARDRLGEVVSSGVSRGKLTQAEADAAISRLFFHLSAAELPEGLDWIIESVPEKLELKRAVLAEAEARSPRHLASNTSAISITALAEGLSSPAGFVGMHFFNPVWSMKLVEVVVGEGSGADAVEAAVEVARGIGKEPIVVRDAPGFASSRLGVLLGLEAIRMVEEGIASPEDIDKAMTLGYGYPMGPLRLGDLVGLDVRLAIAEHLSQTYGERFTPPTLLREMVAQGKLGKKSGEGFYRW